MCIKSMFSTSICRNTLFIKYYNLFCKVVGDIIMTLQGETLQSLLNKQWGSLQFFCDLLKMFVKTLKALTGDYKCTGKWKIQHTYNLVHCNLAHHKHWEWKCFISL